MSQQKQSDILLRAAEQRYHRLLRQLGVKAIKIIESAQTPQEALRRLKAMANSQQFLQLCQSAAVQMATMVEKSEKATWREAAAASSRGKQIYKALMRELNTTERGAAVREIVSSNAQLIKTVPESIAEQLSALTQQRAFEGRRPEAIMEEIRAKAPNLTEVQARRIARTESGKAQTALIQSRAQSLGHAFYRWSCSMDQRVRDSHREMHNVICRWDDPPDPEALAGERSYGHYHPRGIFNCRCTAEPITSMLDITFPARVHVAGKIITVGGAKRFIDLFGDNAA